MAFNIWAIVPFAIFGLGLIIFSYITYKLYQKNIAEKRPKKHKILTRTVEGRLIFEKMPVVGDFLISRKKGRERGFILTPQAKKWIEGTRNDSILVVDERSLVPLNLGVNKGAEWRELRKKEVEWAVGFVQNLAEVNAEDTVVRAPQIAERDRMFETLKTVTLLVVGVALVIVLVNFGLDKWG